MTPRHSLTRGLPLSLLLSAAAIATATSTSRAPRDGVRDLRASEPAPVEAAARQAAAVPLQRFGPGPLHKVWIGAEERDALGRLLSSGAVVRSYDYGTFTVAIVDEERFGGADALRSAGLRVRDEQDLVTFNGIVIDGQHAAQTLAELDPTERYTDPRTMALDPQAGLYVVQFEAPVRDEWVAELQRLGTTFLQFVPMNAYVVQVPAARVGELESLASLRAYIQFASAYEPAFRLHPALRRILREGLADGAQDVTIQLVNTQGVRAEVEQIRSMAAEILSVRPVGPYVNVHARVHPVFFQTLAAGPSVFQLEPRGRIERLDERQGQIMAANTTATGPSAPGYLSWLAGRGFGAGQFTSFSINVADDATSLSGHPDLPSSRIAFTLNPTNQTGAQGGHGFLNAHIVAGFNDGTGSAFEDAGGYNYGLGIAPWARVGSTAIFGTGALNPTAYESQAYGLGARISSNSWGFTSAGSPIADYDANSQEFDFITRDAQGGTAGNQEYLVVFAAGNGGSGSNTVGTPGTAKNVLTVGASENDRQTGTDGCGVANSGANNYNDMATFSSRGPVNSAGGDGRWKPEIVAPGTHIEAGVPQSNYNGSSVCNQYWPGGQTLYGWSSGTSHSTPALAGAAALVRQHFINQSLPDPSPALVKAYLVNTGEYMTGLSANDTLPSNAQGMGNVNLQRAFDGAARILVDQTQLLTATGQSYSVTGSVASSASPFRVTLVWTDAPGPTSGAPYVNDLDLTVTVGGSTYRGNVFSGRNSVTGGAADFRNNTESVFLPAGTTGSFTITVNAASIGGDGVPGNGDTTDQDFALVVYNGSSGPVGPTASFTGSPTSGDAPLTVNFTDTSSGGPTSWSWTFGDGTTSSAQNPSHVYNTPGTYDVTLSITAPGGSDSSTRAGYITVTAPPAPGIADGSFELQTAGSAPAAPWSIDFGSGHVINPAGGTSADGGMPSDGANWLEVSATSTNNATPPSNPGGLTNPPSGGAGVSQSFSYGAGQTLFGFDAAFLRNESANSTYNDWMSVDITDGSTWQNLYYADTSTATAGTSAKYGYAMTAVTSVSVDLASLFPSSTTATTFTVTVQVGNGTDGIQPSIGYADNFTLTGGGPAPPTASFTGTPTSGTAPLSVTFSDTSTGSITSWAWDFGDGTTSAAQNPSHVYTAGGTYSVTLTVTGPGGSDSLTRTNYVSVSDAPPTAGFSGVPTTGAAPLAVSFSDTSTGTVTGWSWTFGDGAASTSQNPTHVYSAVGTYDVSLTVSGPGGSDTLTRTAYITVVTPAPVAGFSGTPTSGPAPLAVSFTDSSTGSITGWSWDFGDGTTSTQQNPGHTYNAVGTYDVSLTVTGPGGSDTLIRTAYITAGDPPPVAGFTGTPTSGTAPLAVSFSDTSTGSVTGWSWDFGDGTTSTQQNPGHTYNAAGTYDVSLTVTGPGGSDTLTRLGYVTVGEPAPLAGFVGTPTSGAAPLAVSFIDTSQGSVTGWSWSFGDGATSTLQNPSHTYAADGTYDVSLTVTGPGGSDTLTRLGYITVSTGASGPVYYLSFTSNTTVPGLGTVRDEDIVSYDAGADTWSWVFDGSDVGIGGTDINAFHRRADGSILMSFNSSTFTVPGLTGGPNGGVVEDSDLVLFTPTSVGASTSGSFSFYFDGSDVGFTTGGEDIDGVYEFADGSLAISTLGSSSASGISGVRDEDVIRFTGTFGASTSGSFSFHFDGSDVGFAASSAYDLNAVTIDGNGDLIFSTVGTYAAAGGSGADEDLSRFSGTFGSATSGSATKILDLSVLGISTGEDVDGVTLQP